jgi:hypothetical protein
VVEGCSIFNHTVEYTCDPRIVKNLGGIQSSTAPIVRRQERIAFACFG